MAYFLSHLPQTLIVLGLLLLVVEILVLGFSTFVLFFVGIAIIITAGLMLLGIIPETILASLSSTAIISAVIAVVCWKPLKRMQNKVEIKQVDNGIIGYTFTLSEALALNKTITHHYSGIDWQVCAKEALVAGTEVKIIKMDVGILTVEKV